MEPVQRNGYWIRSRIDIDHPVSERTLIQYTERPYKSHPVRSHDRTRPMPLFNHP